jgi:hypothetical protein
MSQSQSGPGRPKKYKLRTTISISTEDTFIRLLKQAAKERGVDLNTIIHEAMRSYLKSIEMLDVVIGNPKPIIPPLKARISEWNRFIHSLPPERVKDYRNWIHTTGGLFDNYLDCIQQGKDHTKVVCKKELRHRR